MGFGSFYVSPAAGYTAGLNFLHISGQSLADGNGSGAIITTAQEYDNVQFAKWASYPSAYEPAYAVGEFTETPMYGALGHINELIAEDGINPLTDNYQMLTCNNAHGSYPITVLGKGSEMFTNAISQVASAKAIATTEGRSFKFRGTLWLQGESDNSMSYSDYKTALKRLAGDYADMGRAAASQKESPILITYQTTTNALPNVALAQLDASKESGLIYMAAPLYPFDFAPDGVHLTAESSKLIGGYMGLVYKKVLIDGANWKPLHPTSYVQSGSDVTLAFHVPAGSLVLDTTLIQAQTDYGFSAVDDSGDAIAITAVALVGANQVKITTASPIPAGGEVRYAQIPQTLPVRCNGGAGNLRDSQGDSVAYLGKPMHNWCVLFSMVI